LLSSLFLYIRNKNTSAVQLKRNIHCRRWQSGFLYRLWEEHAILILRAGGIMFFRNVGMYKTTWCQNSENYYLNYFRHKILRTYKQQSVTKAR
jgi:hypothetical protein